MKGPVLVTGSNGFVGSHVVEALLQHGYAVRCLLRPQSQPQWIEALPVEIHRADYNDRSQLEQAVAGCEAVLHFGGATKSPTPEGYFLANTETTKRLLDAAVRAQPTPRLFLLCSSQAALGPSPSLDPLSEDAPPQPITIYGKSKLAAEQACRQYAGRFPIAILRPPAVYGPRDRDVFIFFKLIKYGISPRIGTKDRYFSLVHVEDVAQITWRILSQTTPPEYRLYHLTDGAIHRWSEVSATIAKALQRKPWEIKVPLGLAVGVSRLVSKWSTLAGRVATLNREKLDDLLQQYWLLSSRRAETELDYRPKYDLKQGVEMTARWYKENKWL